MSSHGSKRVIYAALAGNLLIALTKLAAAWYTDSAAMMSEAVHSLVDTGNQGLLLYGLYRAALPADERHPFGYGREIYFWSFVVALAVFTLGGGISVYEGVGKIRHPEPMRDAYVNYVVLGLSLVFEGGSCFVALKEFGKTLGGRSLRTALRDSKDPSLFTVLLEDSAAMVGLVVAFVGILLAQATGLAWIDGATSIVIGGVLFAAAGLLAAQSKALLIGVGAGKGFDDGIRDLVGALPQIEIVHTVMTQHFGPADILVNLSCDFRDDLSAADVERTVAGLRENLRAAFPAISRVFIEARSVAT